ncbi:peptidase domain-containing ABC transporter [Fundidesulfovibrio butyratiphilus]
MPMITALACLKAVADAYGLPFDPAREAERFDLDGQEPDQETLARIADDAGFEATPATLVWDDLAALDPKPALALLDNGNAVVLLGFSPLGEGLALVADPLARLPGPLKLDRQTLEKNWSGRVLLVKPRPGRSGLRCLVLVARHHGLDLSLEGLAHHHALGRQEPSPDELAALAREHGFKSWSKTLAPEDLAHLGEAFPLIARMDDGRMVIVAGAGLARRVPEPASGENGHPGDDSSPPTERAFASDAPPEPHEPFPSHEPQGPEGAHDPQPPIPVVDLVDPAALPLAKRTWPLERFAREWTGQAVLLRRAWPLGDENQPFGLRWFVPEAKRQGKTFFDVALASLFLMALALALPMYFQIVIDKVLVHKSLSTLQVLSLGMVAALVFDALFTFLRGYLLQDAIARMDIRIATRTFAKLVALPLGFFGRSHAGVLVQHMQQPDKIREFLTGKLFFTLLDGMALVVFVPVLACYSLALTGVVLVCSAALAVFLALLVPYFKGRLLRLYQAEGERQAFLVETIRGMETVKSLSLEPAQRRRWDDLSARTVSMRLDVGRISAGATATVGLMEKLMSLAIPWLGVFLVFDHQMTVGALIAFQMLAGRVTHPLVQIVSLLHEYQEKALAVRMLATIMNETPERPPTRGGLRPTLSGDVAFENVTFRYAPGARAALDGVTLRFPAGSFIGVVGRSGSGKSTLGRLLQGLYQADSGLVKMDGHDVREIDLTHLRRHIGVVLQENFLFRGTVRENIALSAPSAGFGEVAWAARLAGADEFIRDLPAGFDTPLEENGSNLSGGQRQRLAIARALLTRPRVLLFDEATSALDAESEEIIQNNLDKMASGRTTIMISHRLSMLAGADSIVVMDKGRVADSGTHEELLKRCAPYRDLWRSQNRHVLGRPTGPAVIER